MRTWRLSPVRANRDLPPRRPIVAGGASFSLCVLILIVARWKAPYPLLLADRFVPGTGLLEILALGLYAAWITARMSESKDTAPLRLRLWLAFSIVFFSQFVLGVAGIDRLLMTGRLHVPVPAVVIAGPIYRGQRFFMPILFLSTLILVGPAWCSHLCYFGAWDALAARVRRRSEKLSRGWNVLRYALFAATPAAALAMRVTGVKARTAGLAAVGFGVVGAAVMILVSSGKGRMVHCTAVCPLGVMSNVLGRVSPFRLRIGPSCIDCGRCTSTCRYGALSEDHVRGRRPGLTCTLCGDCLAACPTQALSYRFLGLSAPAARLLFVTLVAGLHAVFLGVARI